MYKLILCTLLPIKNDNSTMRIFITIRLNHYIDKFIKMYDKKYVIVVKMGQKSTSLISLVKIVGGH